MEQYDHENRLIQSTISGITSASTHNGDGLRTSYSLGGSTTNYTWDVAAGLPVVLTDGTNDYVYGLDGVSATDTSTGTQTQTYLLYDGLGSTVGLTDATGSSTASYSYDAFGALRSSVGGGSNYWLFTGEQRDSDSGFYYLRARQYDPTIGRFFTRDPLPSRNRYAYVGNNPVNALDPYVLLCDLGLFDPCEEVDERVVQPIHNTVSAAGNAFETGYEVQGSYSFLLPTPIGIPIPVTITGRVQFGLHQGPNPHIGAGIGGPPGGGVGVNFYPDQQIAERPAC